MASGVKTYTSASLYTQLTQKPFPTGLEPNSPSPSEAVVAKVIREEHFSLFKLFVLVAPFLALAAYGFHVGGLEGKIMSYAGAGASLLGAIGMIAWQTYEFTHAELTPGKQRRIVQLIHEDLIKNKTHNSDPVLYRLLSN